MKKTLTFLIALLLSSTAYAQLTLNFDTLCARIETQQYLYPQEKIYIHTDKPYYVSGEKVWLRSYLLDAFTLSPQTKSRYVYVDLISPANTVVSRVKIRRDKEAFSGYVQLADTLAEGNYTLCAYTMLMSGSRQRLFPYAAQRMGRSWS